MLANQIITIGRYVILYKNKTIVLMENNKIIKSRYSLFVYDLIINLFNNFEHDLAYTYLYVKEINVGGS